MIITIIIINNKWINAEFLLALLYLSQLLVKALQLSATTAQLCSDRKCTDSWHPTWCNQFQNWPLLLFYQWKKWVYPNDTTVAWSESCEKLLYIWLQVSPSVTGIQTYGHSTKYQTTNLLDHAIIIIIIIINVITI